MTHLSPQGPVEIPVENAKSCQRRETRTASKLWLKVLALAVNLIPDN